MEADTVVIPRIAASGRGHIGRLALRGIGELFVTAGLVVLLFVAYEVYITDLISAGRQEDANAALDRQWSAEANTVPSERESRRSRVEPVPGTAFAKMYIPTFGPDFSFAVVEGVTAPDLEIGPGHYPKSALPGENGNFAVAGHRVGKGAPFNDIDLLRSCDGVVVESEESWFVYRVLPMTEEKAGWANGRGRDPQCAGVAPLHFR